MVAVHLKNQPFQSLFSEIISIFLSNSTFQLTEDFMFQFLKVKNAGRLVMQLVLVLCYRNVLH